MLLLQLFHRRPPRTLKPLEPLKDDILLLGNLTHNTGRALLDGWTRYEREIPAAAPAP